MDYVTIIEKINNMSRIIERNVAEIIVSGLIIIILLSSCGLQKTEILQENYYANCENCDEID